MYFGQINKGLTKIKHKMSGVKILNVENVAHDDP